MNDTLSPQDKRAWIRLIRTNHVGPATFRQLLKRFGDAEAALVALPDITSGKRRFTPPSLEKIEAEMAYAEEIGMQYLASCETAYPLALRAISDAPPIICACGDVSLLQRPAIGIVGARNASAVGRRIATSLAQDLGAAGVPIVSGLARGIDGAAHLAALNTGTIAVVAGGVDVIYPPEHADLTRQIAELGLIVSEMPPGYRPTGRDFPRRNRIISGLSRGVIIVEAAVKSGTLITARFALEQGREVFAVPGSPLDPRCQGTNGLIRQGATLIEKAEDVLEILQDTTGRMAEHEQDMFEAQEDTPDFSAEERAQAGETLLALLGYTPLHRDYLIRESALPAALVAEALLDLVLEGKAEEHSGGQFALSA